MMRNYFRFFNTVILLCCIVACKQHTTPQQNEVVIHLKADADMLHPILYKTEICSQLSRLLFQTLITPHFETFEFTPVLAITRPKLEIVNNQLLITYEIRPEAQWDNGQPITAQDAAFSLKVIKNPLLDAQRIRTYFDFIDSMIFYPDNPRKFTFACKEIYMRAEIMSGDFAFLPPYVYDPRGLIKEFTVHQFTHPTDELLSNPQLVEFTHEFSSNKYQREKGFVAGSGAYELENWETGKRIVLTRKKKWWGDRIKGANIFFDAYPEKLIYEIITDYNTALVAMKGRHVDVMTTIPPKDFIKDLSVTDSFKQYFQLATPVRFAFHYLGFNTRHPFFSDKNVRHALAHLVDVNKISQTVFYGLAEPLIGPVHPSMKKEYNDTVQPYAYEPGKTKKLLEDVGWKDSNGDGTLDKLIKGKHTEFEFDIVYNTGNEQREAVCLLFQEEARKIGIKINVQSQDLNILSQKMKSHQFQMFCAGMNSTPMPFDYKQQWHTESANGGFNFFSFGNVVTDALIDSARKEMDENKRYELSKQLQAIIHQEVPAIFLVADKERMAISKKFVHIATYSLKPGFWEGSFQLAAE